MRFRGLSAATRQHFRRDGGAKKGYATRREAAAKSNPKQKEYLCSFCGLWHVGARTP